jgi:hypothetical protein
MSQNNNPDLFTALQLLAVSGIAGAFFRAALAPEQQWKRRVIQGIAGAAAAIFMGGAAASVFNSFFDAGVYSYLASGFVMGSGGELAVKAFQDKFFGAATK